MVKGEKEKSLSKTHTPKNSQISFVLQCDICLVFLLVCLYVNIHLCVEPQCEVEHPLVLLSILTDLKSWGNNFITQSLANMPMQYATFGVKMIFFCEIFFLFLLKT